MVSMTKKITSIERKLIDASIQLGNIAECPWHYTKGLAQQIASSGKSATELTVGELLEIHQNYSRHINNQSKKIANAQFNLCELIPPPNGGDNA